MSTQNPDVAKNDTPPLLLKLQAQIDDDKDFAWAVKNVGGCTPEEFRLECRQIFADLYETAAAHWDEMLNPEAGWRPRFSGMAVVEHHGPLHSCWLGDFSRAIRNVARNPETDQDDRDFLYFMLGVQYCGWQEYIRQLHAGRIKE